MMRKFIAMVFCMLTAIPAAYAQQQSWVQIEAQPSLALAKQSIRGYAAEIEDVTGFAIGSGWYAVALGPYSPEDALEVLRVYRAERIIPRDSYVVDGSTFRQQFWPVGANNSEQPTQDAPEPDTQVAQAEPEAAPEATPEPADETLREARQSESQLTREEKAELQTALQWAGFYDGRIDASYGRGTRNSMALWQEANLFEKTGVLTTLQRAELLRQYNAVLEGLGVATLQDEGAGIEMKLPMQILKFAGYESPFAHYNTNGDINAQVLLISQKGDRSTLAGLYDIMQTLEIVPKAGPRTLKGDAFTLIGEGALMVSHTQAWLKDGVIKGFTLVWPAGDEERRTRLLGMMQESFTRLPGVIDPGVSSSGTQRADLISGLEIRKPKLSRSGFYADHKGTVVTTTQAIESCTQITIDMEYPAQIVNRDDTVGIAILKPDAPLAPIEIARFHPDTPRLNTQIAVSGYSYGGLLDAPTVTFGQLSDTQGLNGEPELRRLALSALEGDAGGPVIDAGGAVLGMLLPAPNADRQLPKDVSFAADAATVRALLDKAGITSSERRDTTQMGAENLTRHAANMTALVSCWGD